MTPVPDAEDLLLWPCGTRCYRHEAAQMTHKSDDYRVVPFGTSEYAALTADSHSTPNRVA